MKKDNYRHPMVTVVTCGATLLAGSITAGEGDGHHGIVTNGLRDIGYEE